MDLRSQYLDTADVVRSVLADSQVAERWDEPSALAEMTVGSLAGHLSRAVTTVDSYLDAEPPSADSSRLDAPGYFLSLEGIGGKDIDLDSDLHRAVRRRSEEAATVGHAALVSRWDSTVERLRDRLSKEPEDRAVLTIGARAMLLDECLVTRLVEMVVHADDLAVSAGVTSPVFDPAATSSAIGCLVEMARRSHGDVAVLRALTRRERDAVEALRVL